MTLRRPRAVSSNEIISLSHSLSHSGKPTTRPHIAWYEPLGCLRQTMHLWDRHRLCTRPISALTTERNLLRSESRFSNESFVTTAPRGNKEKFILEYEITSMNRKEKIILEYFVMTENVMFWIYLLSKMECGVTSLLVTQLTQRTISTISQRD